MSKNIPLIGISGPTASGKSEVAVELALKLDAEVVNADSVQLYQGLDVGSGKMTLSEMRGVPHHLLSAFEVDQEIDAWSFGTAAREKISEIYRRDKSVILAGGSGLYLQSVIHGLIDGTEISTGVREKFEETRTKLIEEHGEEKLPQALYCWLEEIDPLAAGGIQPADVSRTGRAILCYLETGQSISELQAAHGNKKVHNAWKRPLLVVALLPERALLYSKINKRVQSMWDGGLLEEVQVIQSRYPNCKQLNAVGYRHAAAFLSGDMSESQAIEEMKKDTRRLAKRQTTWWRNQASKLGWNYPDSKVREDLESLPLCDISALISGRFGSEAAVRESFSDSLKSGSGEDSKVEFSEQVFFLPFVNVKL